MSHLRQLDQIAYIRFASVYHQFADLDDLKEELDALEAAATMAEDSAQPPLIPEEELQGLARPARLAVLRLRQGGKDPLPAEEGRHGGHRRGERKRFAASSTGRPRITSQRSHSARWMLTTVVC